MEERPSEDKMFMKESIRKFKYYALVPENPPLKPSQMPVVSNHYSMGSLPEVITSLCTSIHHFPLSSIIYYIH